MTSSARPSEISSLPIRIVLADDHETTRRNLRLLLDGESNVQVVAEARDVFTATRHVFGYAPDVLLLDLRMPGGSTWDAIRRLRVQAPATKIVVVTMEDNVASAQRAIDLGAIGYVLKDTAVSDLPDAIRCAARGEQYVSARFATSIHARPLSGPRAA
jgi:two-component system, NarL family, response regulator NreC